MIKKMTLFACTFFLVNACTQDRSNLEKISKQCHRLAIDNGFIAEGWSVVGAYANTKWSVKVIVESKKGINKSIVCRLNTQGEIDYQSPIKLSS